MKNKSFHFGDFYLGLLSGCVILMFVYIVFLNNPNSDKSVSGTKETVSGSAIESDADDITLESADSKEDADAFVYETEIKDWPIKLGDKNVTYHTPEGFFSLSDQYLENLSDYYKVDSISTDSLVVVGDADTPYSSKTIINADTISDVQNILSQVYGDDFDASEVIESEAYVYMKTGKVPENAADNYKIEEVKTYKVDGIEYVAYEVNYDTTYEAEEEGEKDETVHTQQISCYSKTDDAMEIIVYQAEFDRESALNALEEFLGVES